MNSEVLIEPFFTSKISIKKKEKLKTINKPTLSIDLIPFIEKYNYSYEIEDLKNYLINDSNKSWEIIRENKINGYLQNYLDYIRFELKKLEPELLSYREDYIKSEKLELEIKELEEQIKPIREKIMDLNFELSILESKIGKFDKTYKNV